MLKLIYQVLFTAQKLKSDAENIYRVVSHIKETDNEFTWAVA